MRGAFHAALAFTYGWTLLLVSQSGGMAAAAVTFANYFEPLTGLHISVKVLGVTAIAAFTLVNALGVRAAASTQNGFMVLKIAAIGGFVAVGLFAPHGSAAPVAGAYGGTATDRCDGSGNGSGALRLIADGRRPASCPPS